MLLISDVLYMLVKYASPSGPMCLRCLMLTSSGPVELLFFLMCLFAAWTCVVVSVMLVVCSLRAFLSMCLFVLCILCLTVLVVCWLIRVLSSKEYVCCVCDPSVCLGVPSICQICVFV